MNSMPKALASRGEFISVGWPLIFTVPESRESRRRDLHQRRFAGAVLANQRDYFACVDFEIYFFERDDPWKPFADSLHFEDWDLGCQLIFVSAQLCVSSANSALKHHF